MQQLWDLGSKGVLRAHIMNPLVMKSFEAGEVCLIRSHTMKRMTIEYRLWERRKKRSHRERDRYILRALRHVNSVIIWIRSRWEGPPGPSSFLTFCSHSPDCISFYGWYTIHELPRQSAPALPSIPWSRVFPPVHYYLIPKVDLRQ